MTIARIAAAVALTAVGTLITLFVMYPLQTAMLIGVLIGGAATVRKVR